MFLQTKMAKVSAMDATMLETHRDNSHRGASINPQKKFKNRRTDRVRNSLYNAYMSESNEDNLDINELNDIHFQQSPRDELWYHPIRRFQIPLSLEDPEPNDCDTTAVCLYEEKVASRDEKVPRVVTGTRKGLLQTWNFNHAKFISSIRFDAAPEKERVLLALAPYIDPEEMAYIVAGGGSMFVGFAFIWNVSKNTMVELFSAESKRHRKPISGISIEKINGRSAPLIIVASQDRTVSIWDFATRSCLFMLPKEHTDLLLCMKVHQTVDQNSGTSTLHIVTGSWDKSILFWAITAADLSQPFQGVSTTKAPYYRIRGHRKMVTAMCLQEITIHEGSLSHSATILVTGSLDTSVIVWDFDTKQPLRTLKGHKEKVTAVAVYASKEAEHFLKIISTSEDCTANVWDLATGQITRTIHYRSKLFTCVAFENKFGMMIVTGSSKGPLITNLGKTQRTKQFTTSPVTAINIYTAPEDKKHQESVALIGTIDSTVWIYRLLDHKPMQRVKLHKSRINAVVIYEPAPGSNRHPLVISCDGKAKIKVWDLYTTELVNEFKGYHEGAVLSVALYDPTKVGSVVDLQEATKEKISFTVAKGSRNDPIDLTRPIILAGGTDSHLTFWDLLAPHRNPAPLKKIEKAHAGFVRSIVVYHPQRATETPWVITGSYDKSVIVRNLSTGTIQFKLEGLHTNYVFFIALYDPYQHLGQTLEKEDGKYPPELQYVSERFFHHPALVTSSYDFTLGVWSLDGTTQNKPVHHLKSHTDSVTALSIFVPPTKEEHPLIVSGSIDRMVILWDLFTGEKLQVLVGHTDRVCYITTYVGPDGRNPIVLSGGDDRKTIVWEDSLHQKPFMPTRDDVNRCFESDCLEDDWPLITELTKKYHAKLFHENPHLFHLALHYNRPNFFLKFYPFLIQVLPWMRNYGGKNLLNYAVEKNDLVSLRVILYCWTENLNRDIQDLLTQRLYHSSYFFPDESLKILANKYPKEFENFIVCLRLVRNHYSLLMTEEDYQKDYIYYEHEKAVLFDDEEDDDDDNNYAADEHKNNEEVAGTIASAGRTLYDSTERAIDSLQDGMKNAIEGMENILNIGNAASPAPAATIAPEETSLQRDPINPVCIDPVFVNMKKKEQDILSNPATNTCALCLHPTFRYETSGTLNRFSRYDELWKEKLSIGDGLFALIRGFYYRITSERIAPQPVTSLLVPLRNSARLKESIKLYVRIANQLDSVDIFDSEVGMVSLRFFWDTHAKKYHVLATVRYLSFLLLFITSIYTFEFYYLTDGYNAAEKVCMKILDAMILLIFAYYVFEECYQIQHSHPSYFRLNKSRSTNSLAASTTTTFIAPNSPGGETNVRDDNNGKETHVTVSSPVSPATSKKEEEDSLLVRILINIPRIILVHFLTDAWNLLDAAIFITGIPGIVLRFVYDDDIITGRCFLALCSVSMWFKTLYFMRPFANSGPLVTMIINIAYNIRFYLLVLFCVLAGFTQAFWLLSNVDNTLPWGTVHTAFLTSFFYMLGQNIQQDESGTLSPELATFLIVMFMMIMIILMLNLLIALMGDAFAKVRSQGLAIWRKEQASIIIEESFLIHVKPEEIPPYIHVLKYASDVSSKDPQEYNKLLLELVQQSKKNVTPYTELDLSEESSSSTTSKEK